MCKRCVHGDYFEVPEVVSLVLHEVAFLKVERKSAELTWKSLILSHVKLGPSLPGAFFEFTITCTEQIFDIDASYTGELTGNLEVSEGGIVSQRFQVKILAMVIFEGLVPKFPGLPKP